LRPKPLTPRCPNPPQGAPADFVPGSSRPFRRRATAARRPPWPLPVHRPGRSGHGRSTIGDLGSWLLGDRPWIVSPGSVPVQLPQIMGGAGQQPFAFACGQAVARHRGQFLAGLELPGHRFRGAGPQLVVLPSAGMGQAPPGAGGGRILAQVPGPDRLDLRHVSICGTSGWPSAPRCRPASSHPG
jgi:hypothetical protein